ncbi:unnamed protein product [Dibothriocephalus latus]|uniref:GT23 domain-containing protein n=1 Tax=Dibothriocephalus latus TaxID=60516 RepID=A0A3P6R1M0_DIBLA|nr:unnamed protein product [Dibothriocephalus latus]
MLFARQGWKTSLCRTLTSILFVGLILWKQWATFLTTHGSLTNISLHKLFEHTEEDPDRTGRPNYDVLLRQSRLIINEIGRLSKSQFSENTAFSQLLQQATVQLSARLNIFDQLNGRREKRCTRMKSLSLRLQRQILNLQYPRHCRNKKIALTESRRICGFGCVCHHVAYTFGNSFAMNRTLLIKGNVWGDTFQPITSCGNLTAVQSKEAVHMPFTEYLNGGQFDPPGLADEWATAMEDIHGAPYVWFRGHLLSFLLRPIWSAAETDRGPYVGVHVRRTDKIVTQEAGFHSLSEYMVHVKRFFRLVYLASDDPSVFTEAREQYTDYIFLGDQKKAKTWSDTTEDAIMTDILALAKSDLLVCTASSNVCRLAYELMLAQQPANDDATFNSQSLDVRFISHRSRQGRWKVIADFKDNNLVLGDLYSLSANSSDGFLRSFCALDGNCHKQLIPAYLLQEITLRYSKR